MVADAGSDNAGHRSDDWNAPGQDRAASDQVRSDFGGQGGAANSHARGSAPPDPNKLAQDWVTLWQSELSAMAADPEIRESWQALTNLWAGTMSAMLRGLPRGAPPGFAGNDRQTGQTGTADAARPAPVAAAPDPRDVEIERLTGRVGELEQRLAELERRGRE